MTSHNLNQCWLIVIWTPETKFQRNLNPILLFSFNKMHSKLSSAKMAAIFSRGKWGSSNQLTSWYLVQLQTILQEFHSMIMPRLWIHYRPTSSSTWREFDPDTAYVVCTSVSLGFHYMVMLQTFKRKRHCSGCGVAMGCYGRCIVPGAAIVTSQCYGRYCFKEHARSWAEYLSTPWQHEFTAIMGALSINWFCRTSILLVAYFC